MKGRSDPIFFARNAERTTFMANKQLNQIPNSSQPSKVIEVGTFHQIFDGSKSGHPGYIIWKNDEHNLYLAIKFGTSSNKNNIKMNYSIKKGYKENLVYAKPFLGKRKNFGKNELTEMSITKEKLDNILANLDYLSPSCSPDINSKDRYQYKRNIKKSPHYKGQLSDPMGPADVNNIQKDCKNVNK